MKTSEELRCIVDNFLCDKIKNLPHPWYGNHDHYSFFKSKQSKLVTLTSEEKMLLYPDKSWVNGRDVKMSQSQLTQALAGNFMLPGEEELRTKLLVDANYEKYGSCANYLNNMI